MRRGFALLFLLCAWPAWALEVVATTASMGMLSRVVGGAQVRVTELAPPERDAHLLQARPSMMRALRDAQLVVAVGAELEVGWLPAAISGAANPAILPGKPGYFEAAAQVPLLETQLNADRAHGDVHAAGNPHINLDPQRMATVALALAERMAQLDATQAAAFRQRAQRFADEVAARAPKWRARVAGSAGAVLHHKDGIYLLDFLGLPLLGTIEPIPGVPPTARHLETLTRRLAGKKGIVIHALHQPEAGAQSLAQKLAWPVAKLPLEPVAGGDAAAYFSLIDRWVETLAAAR